MRQRLPMIVAGIQLGPYPLRGGEQYNIVVTFDSRNQEECGVTEGSRNELWKGRTPERFYDAMAWRYGWNVTNGLAPA